MIKDFEITRNPGILLDQDFDHRQIQVEGLKLNDDYRKIELIDIIEVIVKGHYDFNDNFAKRLAKLSKYDGNIYLPGGLNFHIVNERIAAIALGNKYIDNLKKYGTARIMEVHGPPDKVLTDSLTWVTDYVEYAKIFVYSDKKLYFFLDTDTGRIDQVIIGDVDERVFG